MVWSITKCPFTILCHVSQIKTGLLFSVIDFCLTKRLVHDDDTNSSYLDLQLASKHQCIQRAGRTGRTGPGFVFRIAERNFFVSIILWD